MGELFLSLVINLFGIILFPKPIFKLTVFLLSEYFSSFSDSYYSRYITNSRNVSDVLYYCYMYKYASELGCV